MKNVKTFRFAFSFWWYPSKHRMLLGGFQSYFIQGENFSFLFVFVGWKLFLRSRQGCSTKRILIRKCCSSSPFQPSGKAHEHHDTKWRLHWHQERNAEGKKSSSEAQKFFLLFVVVVLFFRWVPRPTWLLSFCFASDEERKETLRGRENFQLKCLLLDSHLAIQYSSIDSLLLRARDNTKKAFLIKNFFSSRFIRSTLSFLSFRHIFSFPTVLINVPA